MKERGEIKYGGWLVIPSPFSTDMIVTELLDPEATSLPSPNQLKGRVLIKHKKLEVDDKMSKTSTLQKQHATSSTATLHKSSSNASFQVDDEVESFMSDLSNQRKNGYLYMQDPIDKVRRETRVTLLN